jgi:hypothetical protein
MLAESLVGGLVGGLLRLAPEVLKVFDRKNERAHELAMANIEVTIAEKKIEAGLRAGEQQIDMATLDAMGEALRGQAEMAKAGGQWVSAISALVRPVFTFWMLGIYTIHKTALLVVAHEQGGKWSEVFAAMWNEQDWVLFSAIASFWFVSRVYDRKPK